MSSPPSLRARGRERLHPALQRQRRRAPAPRRSAASAGQGASLELDPAREPRSVALASLTCLLGGFGVPPLGGELGLELGAAEAPRGPERPAPAARSYRLPGLAEGAPRRASSSFRGSLLGALALGHAAPASSSRAERAGSAGSVRLPRHPAKLAAPPS